MRRLHILAGVTGFIIILGFWSLAVFSHLIGDEAAVVAVKRAIPWGLPVSDPGPDAHRYQRYADGATRDDPADRGQTPADAGHRPQRPSGTGFVVVQMVELAAGALNIMLMGLNIRDGRIAARMRRAGVGGRS